MTRNQMSWRPPLWLYAILCGMLIAVVVVVVFALVLDFQIMPYHVVIVIVLSLIAGSVLETLGRRFNWYQTKTWRDSRKHKP